MLEIDWGDEGATLHLAFPPVALWLSLSSNWRLISQLLPHRVLSENYPDTMVVDEREIGVNIYDGTLRIKPWVKSGEWCKSDPWWIRGLSFDLNPLRSKFVRLEFLMADGVWRIDDDRAWDADYVPLARWEEAYPYAYVLKNGTVQSRTATVRVERRSWRPRCLFWTRLFEKTRTTISVSFDQEVGEESGSWKGGTTGCSYELLPGETPEQCLRRMEKERKF